MKQRTWPNPAAKRALARRPPRMARPFCFFNYPGNVRPQRRRQRTCSVCAQGASFLLDFARRVDGAGTANLQRKPVAQKETEVGSISYTTAFGRLPVAGFSSRLLAGLGAGVMAPRRAPAAWVGRVSLPKKCGESKRQKKERTRGWWNRPGVPRGGRWAWRGGARTHASEGASE